MPSLSETAARIANTDTREDALFTIVAAAFLLQETGKSDGSPDAARLREDIEWLARLGPPANRSLPRSPVLDPAAWMIQLKLKQQGLRAGALVSPLGLDTGIYLRQVFDRSDERLAWAVLPELLWQIEPRAALVWQELLAKAEDDDAFRTLWLEAHGERMAAWAAARPPANQPPATELLNRIAGSLDVMVQTAMSAGPPDRDRLYRIRFDLIAAMPGLESAQRWDASVFLRLANMVDGLHEGRYFAFAEGLLAIAAEMLGDPPPADPIGSVAVHWLTTNLTMIAGALGKSFALVDPRLNSSVAAVFDIVRSLGRLSDVAVDPVRLQRQLAEAVAQLALLIPDLDFYFNLPVRDTIAGGLDACIGVMVRREEDGSPAMTRELYDDCQQSIVDLASKEARSLALAGDPDGPFGDDELQRELTLTSSQRINYGIGYLHDRYATGCQKPDQPLPNPLEWSALATLLAWFAGQSPIYFQTPDNEARLASMREIGRELQRVISEQVDCFAGAGAAVNDPVSRSLVDYREALETLGSGINGAIFDFRSELLKAGADIVLQRGASQPTAYRPDDLMIGPCDPQNVCEMSGELSSTRALLGLFTDHYLIADQSGLGEVEICYDHMSWVNRRSEQVRADDTNVANYFGMLEFELVGRYRAAETIDEVFRFRFTSPEEQHYLFAAATEEVLGDGCPVEWIGQRIVTPLRSERTGIVPNRLTYLAAPRMLPSRLLANNWERGAEWRDWFITGIGVERLDHGPLTDITADLNQHLQALYRTEQAAIYQSILQPEGHGESLGIESLYEEAERLNTVKLLIRQQFTWFYPELLAESDVLRTAVAGQGGLLDIAMLSRFRVDSVSVNSLNSIAFNRLNRVQREWQRQPEATRRMGSIADSVVYALLRLNELYVTFFAEPAVPASPVEASRGG